MNKFYSTLLYLSIILGLFSSCNDDNDCPGVDPQAPIINITSGNLSMNIGDSIILKANSISLLPTTYSWSMDSVEVSTDSIFIFKKDYSGDFEVQLTATNEKGSTVTKTQIHVNPGRYKEGTFILSEGSYSTPGKLSFISTDGNVTVDAYEQENGGKLGTYSQDLFIHNHKMYIVSQNGGNDGGYLTILNAETLKKERAFQEELSENVSRPSHVAVLDDDNIYLRDNNGIKRFQPSTGEITLIEGSQKARKNTMAVCKGKLFVVFQPHTYTRTRALFGGFLKALDAAGVRYTYAEHAKADTIDDVVALGIEGTERVAKNLFVRDDKRLNYYVLTVRQDRHVSLKEAQESMGSRKLTFADEEELQNLLGLEKGSVTPLGFMNDGAKKVKFVLDSEFKGTVIGVHPNDNTATVWLAADDIVNMIRKHGNFVYYLKF